MILSYDISKMGELLKSFYTVTKMRIVVFNDEFVKIAEYPGHNSTFCSLIRGDPEAEKKCRASDRFACEKCREIDSLYAYTCHAGLTETVAPVRHGRITIGYVMFGQVLQQANQEAYWPVVRGLCARYDIDAEDLKRAYFRKTAVDFEHVRASAQLLEACAGYLWLHRYISLQENTLPKQIDAYINENLHADLSVGALCARFSISRSKLYQIAAEYYGKGIEQFTRGLRIERAKALLTETDAPVSEVSAQVGYGDYNYFIKVFKKEAGITPARFRKASVEKHRLPPPLDAAVRVDIIAAK